MKLALAQIRVVGGEPAVNLQRAECAIMAAGAGGADIALLPEALDCGWTHPSARELAGAIPGGSAYERLREAAARARIYVCAGIVERAGDVLFNAAVLFSPRSELLLHHRKIHELEIAQNLYARGDRLAVAHTALGTLGVMICADAFAPGQSLSRALGLMGASLILSPCAWAVPADHDNTVEPYGQLWRDAYGPVARDFRLWIAGASNVGSIPAGPWSGRKCIGCSLLVGPDGLPHVEGPYGEAAETLLFADAGTSFAPGSSK
ncbi:MAG: carbon-nitrogen hydrolase family protein [Verrucomicrobiales bacterium]